MSKNIKKLVDLFYKLCAEELAALNVKNEFKKAKPEKPEKPVKAVTESADKTLKKARLELTKKPAGEKVVHRRSRAAGLDMDTDPTAQINAKMVRSYLRDGPKDKVTQRERSNAVRFIGSTKNDADKDSGSDSDQEFVEIDLTSKGDQEKNSSIINAELANEKFNQHVQEAVLAKHFPHYFKIYKESGKFLSSIPQLFGRIELKAANEGAAEYIVRKFALKNGPIRVARDGEVKEVWAGGKYSHAIKKEDGSNFDVWEEGLIHILREISETSGSQTEFLENVSDVLLTPYYQELDELDNVIAEDKAAEIERKKELQKEISKRAYKGSENFEDWYARKPLVEKLNKKIVHQVEETFADIRRKEVARINANIKGVKLTINRGLAAYNKSRVPQPKDVDLSADIEEQRQTVDGARAPFLSRIVALANEPGSFWSDFQAKIDELEAEKRLQIKKDRGQGNGSATEIGEVGLDNDLSESLISKNVRHVLWKKALEKTDQAYYDLFVYLEKNRAQEDAWNLFFQLQNKEFNEHYFESFWDDVDQALTLKHAIVEAEWKRVTRKRKSFNKRLADLKKRISQKEEGEDGKASILSPQEVESRAKIQILLSMKSRKPKDCDKCYTVVEYSPGLLKKAKDKTAKHINTALRTTFSLTTGASEGVVAGVAIAGLIALIPGVNVALPLILGIVVGIMGGLVNMATLNQEGKEPLKEIFRLRLFGEAGNMLRKGKLGWGIFFVTSTVGYSLAAGIFTVVSLVGLGCPWTLAVFAGIMCFAALWALYRNMVTKLVKNGGLEKLKRMFNLKQDWINLQIEKPEMSKVEKVLCFIFVKIMLIKILGFLAKLLALVAFGKAFFDDADKFSLEHGMSEAGSSAVSWIGVVLSSPVALLFIQKKMEAVWEKIKEIFVGTEGIFALGADGKRHLHKDRLAYFAGTALNSFAVGILKVVFLTAIFPLVLIAGMFGGVWALHNKVQYRINRAYRQKVDQDRLNNHAIHAKFNSAMNESIRGVAGNLGGMSTVGNASGQGALTAVPAAKIVPSALKTSSPIAGSANPSSFAFVFNVLTAATSFILSGLSSFILNYEGLHDALDEFTGDGQHREKLTGKRKTQVALATKTANSWKELGRMMKLVTMSIFYLIAQHGCKTRSTKKGAVSKESFVKAIERKPAKADPQNRRSSDSLGSDDGLSEFDFRGS